MFPNTKLSGGSFIAVRCNDWLEFLYSFFQLCPKAASFRIHENCRSDFPEDQCSDFSLRLCWILTVPITLRTFPENHCSDIPGGSVFQLRTVRIHHCFTVISVINSFRCGCRQKNPYPNCTAYRHIPGFSVRHSAIPLTTSFTRHIFRSGNAPIFFPLSASAGTVSYPVTKF